MKTVDHLLQSSTKRCGGKEKQDYFGCCSSYVAWKTGSQDVLAICCEMVCAHLE